MVSFGRDEEATGGNAVLLASDRAIPDRALLDDEASTALSEDSLEYFAVDADVLRDDYAPADQLLTPT